MSLPRRVATVLLRHVARSSSEDRENWAAAMLRELDFIENDWAALFFAIGSTTAIFRRAVPRAVRRRLGELVREQGGSMSESFGRKAAGVAIGAGVAVAFALGMTSIVYLLFYLFPAWDFGPIPWWVGMIVVPEIIFIVAVVRVWRRRRFVAVGILLSAVTMAVHFVVHATRHVH